MDKNAIKKYAVWARNELITRVSQKALQYGITKTNIVDAAADSINGKLLTDTEKKQRQALIIHLKEKGFEQVMEEVAYTWFNRFSALRFMEVNGYLPSHVRVFTDEENNFKPQIITEAIHLEMDGLDMEKVYAFKEADKTEELYKYLLITQCNALNKILPGMFQRISDYTELLLPDNLLREGSVIQRMIEEIPEDNFDIHSENGQVEIIGWLYQYYNDEKKNEVININKGTVKKEDVPAATQLFTTDWVVRYIIDNSVGRYWIERNPNSSLKKHLEYLVTPKNGEIPHVSETITPQDLTVFDPCMGSAHFLVYAFEVLMKIYVEYGYSEREAALEIVQNNIYGLDIDDRASQLAYFAVMMKARQYDRRFLTRGVQPHVYAIRESNHLDTFALEYFYGDNVALKKDMQALVVAMKDAKEYGSTIQLPPVDFGAMYSRFEVLKEEITIYKESIMSDLLPFVKVSELMSKKYTVVTTNPPYLNKYDAKLKSFVNENYKDFFGDLFSVFMYRNFGFCKKDGYCGFMTPFVWMFLKTYEKLREFFISSKSIATLIQMEYSAFEEATVPICTFVIKNATAQNKGQYIKLSDFKGGMEVQREKVIEAIKARKCDYLFENTQENFSKIPGSPIAFWTTDKTADLFLGDSIADKAFAKAGIVTGDDKTFLRLWYEISLSKIVFDCNNYEYIDSIRWVPMNKGGSYRKYYGNYEYVMDIYNLWTDGKTNQSVRRGDTDSYFQEAITWSMVTSSKASFRYSKNKVFGVAAPAIFMNKIDWSVLGYLNSKVVEYFNGFLNPTINILTGNILSLPYRKANERVEFIVKDNVFFERADWDSFETSWDFKEHPLVQLCHGTIADDGHEITYIKDVYNEWKFDCNDRFNQLKANEEELNRIFIEIYGLQDELTPEVEDKDVTVRKADLTRDIKSLISYAVGCMFGRYSLDVEGLAYAGGEWDASKYRTLPADRDNIIPICDDEYFEDDIVGHFIKFIEVVYGRETLDENLKFIANALGSKGNPKDVIRNYFLNDFYNDHVKMYQKRPIYWQFDSGKKNGFKCLIYMHRYREDTIARIRTDYVHEQQSRYRTAIADLEQRINGASTSDRVKLNKQLTKLKDQEAEIRTYEEKIHHLADQMIRIDLDDGVKNNYEIFNDVLAKIK